MATIADYALIGDCRTAALVSRDGEIAWWCAPHFSSPPIFASLLDVARGGRCVIAPMDSARVERRYVPATNVLETIFRAEGGAFKLIDAMPLPCGSAELRPMRELLRGIEGIEGEARVRIEIAPSPELARAKPRVTQRSARIYTWEWGGHLLLLHSEVPLEIADGAARADIVVRAGQKLWLSLVYAHDEIAVIAGLGDAAGKRVAETAEWWQRWSARASYQGPHRDAVVRSALVLKLLSCVQTGAVIAAPSASLPEWLGGDRNWDYRYCWLRDAALTMRAFTGLGYLQEARAFLDWLLHATRLTWPRLNVLYDIHGRTDLPERELEGWTGFRDSRPVRIGNDAREQLQLDVYGAVCYAARNLADTTGELQRDEARLLNGFGRAVCECWQAPDNGIWEIRDPRRAYTFSRIMCWVALDSLRQLEAAGRLRLKPEVAATATAIRDCVESRGFSVAEDSYVATLDGAQADASLLLGGCLGYREPSDPRMRGTFDFVHRKLARKGLLMRYEAGYDGNPTPEGAFGICSFFAVDHLAKRGERDRARKAFEHVVGFANDVGLLSEEIDPDSGELLGNFPQAYTHVGLINAALGLAA